jgi:hypothetical protein
MEYKELKGGLYRFYCRGGYFEICLDDSEKDYPGVDVEFVADGEDAYLNSLPEDELYTTPRVRFELEEGKLHALVWGDSAQEDYTDEVPFRVPFDRFHELSKTETTK